MTFRTVCCNEIPVLCESNPMGLRNVGAALALLAFHSRHKSTKKKLSKNRARGLEKL